MKAIIISKDKHDFFPIADSAIGRDVMPLFIPNNLAWEADLRLAFRIGRLGKMVAPKFAMRYVDAVSIVAVMHPRGEMPRWLSVMDSAVTTGQWRPMPDSGIEMVVSYDNQDFRLTQDNAACESAVTEAIVALTSIATIKTGDIIIPTFEFPTFSLIPNTRIVANINSQTCLSLKVK